MSKLINQEYLKSQQYQSPNNLEARIYLHKRFGTNPYDWQQWVYDQLELQEGMHILEVGCGPASLWRENLSRLPANVQITLGDLSFGMAKSACETVGQDVSFNFMVVDAQAIPLISKSFDLVIANHMLYHVPDLPLALRELDRVLKPGGRFFAATNGFEHLKELRELIRRFNPDYQEIKAPTRRFALENAPEILGEVFDDVEVRIFEGSLVVTEVEPLVQYVLSMWDALEDVHYKKVDELRSYLHSILLTEGAFRITTSSGLTIGTRSD